MENKGSNLHLGAKWNRNSLQHDYIQHNIYIYTHMYTLEHACSMLGKVKHILPNGGFMVMYHGTK